MANVVVRTGSVSTWTNFANLIATAGDETSATLTIVSDELDDTALASGGIPLLTAVQGLSSWTVNIAGQIEESAGGAQRADKVGISWSGLPGNARSVTLDFAYPALESTVYTGSLVQWREFLPGIPTVSGTIEGYADSANGPVLPTGLPGSSLTITITDHAGTPATSIITGTAMLTGNTRTIAPGQIAGSNYSFRYISGVDLDNGTKAADIWDDLHTSGALKALAAGSLTFSDGVTSVSGSAFPTSLSISLPVDGIATYSVTAQGTGALT